MGGGAESRCLWAKPVRRPDIQRKQGSDGD